MTGQQMPISGHATIEGRLTCEAASEVDNLVRALRSLGSMDRIGNPLCGAIISGLRAIQAFARNPSSSESGDYSCALERFGGSGSALTLKKETPEHTELEFQLDADGRMHGIFVLGIQEASGRKDIAFDFEVAPTCCALRRWDNDRPVRYVLEAPSVDCWVQKPRLELTQDPLASSGQCLLLWERVAASASDDPPRAMSQRQCGQCGSVVRAQSKFCGHCGAAVIVQAPELEQRVCSQCGQPIKTGAKFCGACGARVASGQG